jgi:hypothetical protein
MTEHELRRYLREYFGYCNILVSQLTLDQMQRIYEILHERDE